jgi:hypothetical protein
MPTSGPTPTSEMPSSGGMLLTMDIIIAIAIVAVIVVLLLLIAIVGTCAVYFKCKTKKIKTTVSNEWWLEPTFKDKIDLKEVKEMERNGKSESPPKTVEETVNEESTIEQPTTTATSFYLGVNTQESSS